MTVPRQGLYSAASAVLVHDRTVRVNSASEAIIIIIIVTVIYCHQILISFPLISSHLSDRCFVQGIYLLCCQSIPNAMPSVYPSLLCTCR